jgi:hypothetical protein
MKRADAERGAGGKTNAPVAAQARIGHVGLSLEDWKARLGAN